MVRIENNHILKRCQLKQIITVFFIIGIILLSNAYARGIKPSLYEGHIVWNDDGINYFNGEKTEKISDSGVAPSFWDGKVAWNDRGIYYWDGRKTTKIADKGTNPSLHNGKIAWSNRGIYYWDGNKTIWLLTKEETHLSMMGKLHGVIEVFITGTVIKRQRLPIQVISHLYIKGQ